MNPNPAEQRRIAAEFRDRLPVAHRKFLIGLRPYFECGDYFFVHAGVRPGVPLAAQQPYDLLWIRDEFLTHEGLFPKIIVHGHTPVAQPDIRPNRINIDTGAYATGRLTCLKLQGTEITFV
jgi:serine/threonine protein phosphatase 1